MSLLMRLLLVFATAFSCLPARAQAITQTTLDKIREYRAVYIGHRELAVPFAYMVGDEPFLENAGRACRCACLPAGESSGHNADYAGEDS